MAKQASFAKGEIAPSLYARTDLAMYGIGLRTCRNMLIAKQGGAYNRPGMDYIGNARYEGTKKIRLIEFVFSDDDTYILEFGEGYIRFIRNGARVLIESASAWSSATTYAIGDIVESGGIHYYCRIAHSNRTPISNPTYWYPQTLVDATLTSIFQIPTSFTESQLPELQYTQTNDVLILVHKDYAPMELIRAAHTGWTLKSIVFAPSISAVTGFTGTMYGSPGFGDGATWSIVAVSETGEESFVAEHTTTQTFTGSAYMMLSWNAVTGAASYKIWRKSTPSTVKRGLMIETTQTNYKDLNTDDPTDDTSFPITTSIEYARTLFRTDNNYPGTVLYSQQRLILGQTTNDPDKLWASRIGSYKNFIARYPVSDDDPISFSLAGKQANIIRHIRELKQLLALSSSGEWAINGDTAGVLRPDSINAKQQSYVGSSEVPPVNVGGSILFAQARGSIISEIGYSFQEDGYTPSDLTILSHHLFEGKEIVDMAYQQTPNSIVWVVLDDGTFLSLTYIKEQEMLAWTRHDTDGLVENVAVVPEDDEDKVYFVVKRTINGTDVRYIETLKSRTIGDVEDAVFMDSSLTYDGVPVTSVSGLEHLFGKDVSVFADGFVVASPNNPAYTKITVPDSGIIQLGGSYSKVHVGLPYLSDLETLDIDSYAGEKKIVTNLRAFIEKSRGFWAGSSDPGDTNALTGLTETRLRTTEALDEPISLKTEEVNLNIRGEWSKGGRIFIRNVDPIPLAILSIVPGGFVPQGGR